MTLDFRARLEAGTLLFDGAMGTEIYARGFTFDQSLEMLNLTHPDLIKDIHLAYIAAGADVIETNTFGANRIRQEEYGLAEQAVDMARAGVRLAIAAREESGQTVWVGASISSLGKPLQPYGILSQEEARAAYAEIITAMAEAGADLLVFETYSDLEELLLAVRTARALCELPIVAHMTFDDDGVTARGYTPENVALALQKAGVDAAGANCSVGPAVVYDIIKRMREAAPTLTFSAIPNAGYPVRQAGRMLYPSTPEYFATYAHNFQDAGVGIIGGCCGTTPAHIRAMRAALDKAPGPELTFVALEKPLAAPKPAEEETVADTGLAQALATNFVATVEMSPPKGHNPQRMIAQARSLQDAGVTAINVTDSPRARMRMSPWAAAYLLQSHLGIETILHFPTRGRNLIRVQSDLLAGHALNIRNLFVVMGDPTSIGDFPQAHDTFDIAPSALVALIKQQLNQGRDQAGQPLGSPTHFFVGAAVNLGNKNLEREIRVLRRKLDGGADFLLSQPLYDPAVAERFFDAWGGPLPVPVIAGLLPLASSRHAEFLHNEVPGIDIPRPLRDRMAEASGPEGEGVAIARDMLSYLKTWAQGVYLMPPFGRFHLVEEILQGFM